MHYVIDVSNTAIPYGVQSIAEGLPSLDALRDGDEVSLHFTPGEYLYLPGLVMLAAWRKRLPMGITVTVDDGGCVEAARKYLTNVGFREVIETGHEHPSVFKRIGRVPLQPITNKFSSEATVAEIISIFEEYAGHVKDTTPFKILLSELCENVLAHSESTSPGYVCARINEQSWKTEIAIADTGIGIRESFTRGTNENVKARLKKGAGAIELAVDGLNSSKPTAPSGSLRSYYGFGLLITRRLVEENRGSMTVISGNEMLIVDRFQRKQIELSRPWPGAFVGLLLDLGNPLPLEEIYEEATGKLVPDTRRPTATVHTANGHAKIIEERGNLDQPVQSEARLQLQHYGSELLTREVGTVIRADLAVQLAARKKVFVLLDGVSDITPSVADEAFGKVAELIGFARFEEEVQFVGGDAPIRRLIEFVLKTRCGANK